MSFIDLWSRREPRGVHTIAKPHFAHALSEQQNKLLPLGGSTILNSTLSSYKQTVSLECNMCAKKENIKVTSNFLISLFEYSKEFSLMIGYSVGFS